MGSFKTSGARTANIGGNWLRFDGMSNEKLVQGQISTVMFINVVLSAAGAYMAYTGYKLVVIQSQSKKITQENVMPMVGGYLIGQGFTLMVSGVISCIMGRIALDMVDAN